MIAVKLNTIGERLKYARICVHLSQRQVAEKMGVNQKTVSNMEKNVGFSTHMLAKAARALEVDYAWLQNGFGNMPEPIPKAEKSYSHKEEIEKLKTTVDSMAMLLATMTDNITHLTTLVEALVENQSTGK